MGNREIRVSGSRSPASSSRLNAVIICRTVPGSNRSRLNSARPAMPPFASGTRSRERSNLVDSVCRSSTSTRTPGSSSADIGTFRSTSRVCTSGTVPADRSATVSATILSNGRSWLAYAARQFARAARTSSRKVGSPEVSMRSGRVFTKNPTSGSTSTCTRLAIGEPMIISGWPLHRRSRRAYAASSTMYCVASSASASCSTARTVPASRSRGTDAPSEVRTAGRGLSAGSSSTGAPSRYSRQYAS